MSATSRTWIDGDVFTADDGRQAWTPRSTSGRSAGIAPTPEAKAAVHSTTQALRGELAPWAAAHTYLNFSETQRPASEHFSETALHRLRRVKGAYDPQDVVRGNQPL